MSFSIPIVKIRKHAAIHLLASAALVFAAISKSWGQERPPILEQMAKTYGLDSWNKIGAIRYTWNAQSTGINVSRSWEWEPKTDKVSFEGKDKNGKSIKFSYMRSQLAGESEMVRNEIDPQFSNDNYWLLFPFHAYWDKSAKVQDTGTKKLPIGRGSAEEIVVKYSSEPGSYISGDTWNLFVGSDHRVHEIIYRPGINKKPIAIVATWSDYKRAGPLLFSTQHRGTADGKPMHFWFSDVAVKMTGSEKWIKAQ